MAGVNPLLSPVLQPEDDENRRCQFCSYRGTLTREHLWPEAFQTYFPNFTGSVHQTWDIDGKHPPKEWVQPPFRIRRKIDCAKCNNERLRDIEVAAAPWIWRMAQGIGEPTALDLPTQQKIAAFALRMAAVGQYIGPDLRPVPRSHREHLVANGSPPPLVEVWAYLYSGIDWAFRVETTPQAIAAAPGEPVPSEPNAYFGLIRMGRLVLEIAAMTAGGGLIPYPFHPPSFRSYTPIWPLVFGSTRVWPPAGMLSPDGLAQRLAAIERLGMVQAEPEPGPPPGQS